MIERVATLPQVEAAIAEHPADTLELWSPENGAEIQGVMWFVMLQKAMRQAFPDREPNLVVDCGIRADLAVEALRLGLPQVALKGSAEVAGKVADIAANLGGKVIFDRS